MKKLITLLISMSMSLLTACVHSPVDTTATYDNIREELNTAIETNSRKTAPVVPPAEITAAILDARNVQKETDSKNREPRFDITVSSAPARDFFMGLVEGADYNMVLHPEVNGDVSLALRNVTIHDVMKTVHHVYGYEYEYYQHTRTFQVLPIRLQSRLFQIDYLSLVRSGTSGTRVSSGEITQSMVSQGSGGSTTSDTETVTSSEIKTENYADFWGEITRALTAIIGDGDGRSVVVNPHTGLLVIRAMPTELREVERFLQKTQKNLHRQVILEAKILEVELNNQYQTGINWAAVVQGGSGESITIGQTGGGSVFNNGSGFLGSTLGSATAGYPASTSGNTFSLDPANAAALLGSSAFGGVFSMALELNNFAGLIELLEGQGNVQVLSSPRIAAMNNQKAVIKVGSDEFFITDIETNSNTSSSTTSNNTDVEFTPFFSGIALDVTPQINEVGMVTLHVHPKISEVNSSVKNIPLAAGDTQEVELARSTVRESDTVVRARSGQVIVIGGLMQNMSSDSDAGVPGLGDVPIVGSAFKHKKQTALKSELVILLKPVVVNGVDDWQQSIRGSRDRLSVLNPALYEKQRE